MSEHLTLIGTENLKRIFAEFPEGGYRKPMNKAFRAAAGPVQKAMIRNLPEYLSPLRRVIKVKTSRPSKGEPSAAVGVFNDMKFVNRKGIAWSPWVMAYWHNYGTLSWRTSLSRLHTFKTARKSKTAHWDGGIRPKFFIERGWEESKDQAQKTFEQVSDAEITKFFEERALR